MDVIDDLKKQIESYSKDKLRYLAVLSISFTAIAHTLLEQIEKEYLIESDQIKYEKADVLLQYIEDGFHLIGPSKDKEVRESYKRLLENLKKKL